MIHVVIVSTEGWGDGKSHGNIYCGERKRGCVVIHGVI